MNTGNLKDAYVFYLPAYQKNSNGIACIWESAYQFSKFRTVSIIVTDLAETSATPEKFKNIDIYFQSKNDIGGSDKWFHKSEFIFNKNSIQVHPDDPHGYLENNEENDDSDKDKIVKFIMCRSLMLSSTLFSMPENNYGLSYSNAVSTVFPSYLIINDAILNIHKNYRKQKKKNKVLIYYGKTRYGQSFKNLKKIIKEFDEYEIIHRLYPKTTKELYKKISESSLFISMDPLTSLIHESTLLGTPAYVFDSVFKEFYDNFDFKLHGFYYDLKSSDLDKVFMDSKNLAERANKTAADFMLNIDERTIETINNIENYFSNNLSSKKAIEDARNEDITFFNEKWKIPAIYNCISYKTIFRFHATNKYNIFGIIVFYLNRIRIHIRNEYILRYLTLEEKTIIKKFLGREFISTDKSREEQERIAKYWK